MVTCTRLSVWFISTLQGHSVVLHAQTTDQKLVPSRVCKAKTLSGSTFNEMLYCYNFCNMLKLIYRSADKSLVRPTSRCILFDGENISFDASLVIYINSTNIPPIMIINRIYETQNLLSL